MAGVKALAKANGTMKKPERPLPLKKSRRVDGTLMLKTQPGTQMLKRLQSPRAVLSAILLVRTQSKSQKTTASPMPITSLSRLPRSWKALVSKKLVDLTKVPRRTRSGLLPKSLPKPRTRIISRVKRRPSVSASASQRRMFSTLTTASRSSQVIPVVAVAVDEDVETVVTSVAADVVVVTAAIAVTSVEVTVEIVETVETVPIVATVATVEIVETAVTSAGVDEDVVAAMVNAETTVDEDAVAVATLVPQSPSTTNPLSPAWAESKARSGYIESPVTKHTAQQSSSSTSTYHQPPVFYVKGNSC